MKTNKRFVILQDDQKKKTWVFEEDLGWLEQPPESWEMWVSQHKTVRRYPNTFIQMLGLG